MDEEPSEEAPGATLGRRLADYAVLVKPGIMLALLISCFSAMVVAAGGLPPPTLVAATLVGGALASASAAALNNLLERDRDAKMRRTRRRPLPAHRLEPSHAAVFATVLAGAACIVLTAFASALAAALALSGLVFYAFVYTLWLKPLTAQNIVIGGAAGCFPALVGWTAVTGTIGPGAVLIALIVFLWTPPHFWSLALLYKDDYAQAEFPMLPVTRGEEVTRRQILAYSALLVAVTALLVPLGVLGLVYLLLSAALGAIFLAQAATLFFTRKPTAARALFRYSNAYLALLAFAMVLDVAWPF
ncbi:MAG TPA: heme o synthase [Candidatus Thermoplasmatota archaeon]|nr:heme o synthase [Candidatus Thermoplasmatota archaeon]